MWEPGPRCCAALLLIRVFFLSWTLMILMLSSSPPGCEANGGVIIGDDSTSALIINSRSAAAAAADSNDTSSTTTSNVSDWPQPTPGIEVSLSLSIDQVLNRNASVKMLPTVSLSLSLSVFGEMKANPFGFVIKLPLAEQAEPQYPNQQPPDEQEQLLKPGAPLQPQASGRWAKCSYTVTIKTSCSSPRVTRDAVSLAFGDAYRNEVYAARLDDPASGTFERCSIDTFRVMGPCGGRTCYLYLYRSGRDGWIPEYVKVFYSPSDPRAAVTFFYKVPLPESVWYGFNLCHGGAAATTPSTTLDLGALGQKRDVTDGDLPTTTASGTQTGAGRPQPT